MEEQIDRLPWTLAALAALLVGMVGLFSHVELWTGLARAGVAFAAFGALGLAGRALLQGRAPFVSPPAAALVAKTPQAVTAPVSTSPQKKPAGSDSLGT